MKYTERIDKIFQIQKRKILNLFSIRNRITFKNLDYKEVENQKTTWFIDPPYIVTNKTSLNKTYEEVLYYKKIL